MYNNIVTFVKNVIVEFTKRFDFKSDLIFSDLNTVELAKIKSVTENLKFSSGEKLFYEDGIPTGLFQLIAGSVKKYKTVLDKQHQIFYIYAKNDLFGYHALFSEERYQDSCEALEDIEVNFISSSNFKWLLKEIPSLQDSFLINMAHEFGVLANTIAILTQKSQNVRLALNLMILQKRFKSKIPEFKGVELTREDLANIVGTSRESLYRSINFLKKQKFITVNKRMITVIDESGIEDFINS